MNTERVPNYHWKDGLPMAASPTVPELSPALNVQPIIPRRGVVSLSGYGVVVSVNRGHLVLRDGIGRERRQARLARVGHGLKRLVVIANDGLISLAALRWLHDQKAAFVMLERSGTVLSVAGPAGPRDGRLRRAQAVAAHTGQSIPIARALLVQKLQAQEGLARTVLGNGAVADDIATARAALDSATTIDALRWTEARAAMAYWSAWHGLPVHYPKASLRRVPEHWRTFGARRSPLTASPRLAVNPPNAMLNYLYALLEAEARIAAVAVGLDPNLGFLHADTDSRASLACDLMEPIRPDVDAYVLDWITREPLRREWFFETPDGNCRLMAPFASQLAETTATWAQCVAPIAERVASMLGTDVPGRRKRANLLRTPLTQRRRREAKQASLQAELPLPVPPRVCRECGSPLRRGRAHCAQCAHAAQSVAFTKVLTRGRAVAHTWTAQAQRAATQRRHGRARAAWRPEDQPSWLTGDAYTRDVRPRLTTLATAAIARALGVSNSYAAQIRSGTRRPHPRHWLALAQLARVRPGPSEQRRQHVPDACFSARH